MPLDQMSDEAFADADHGEGVYIALGEKRIVSPFDGTVTDITPDGCTIRIRSMNGLNVMLKTSFGENAILMARVRKDQRVRKGDLLITSDDRNKSAKNIGVAVVITNSNDYLGVIPVFSKRVDYGDLLITTIVSEAV